jgi:hypothetical protein
LSGSELGCGAFLVGAGAGSGGTQAGKTAQLLARELALLLALGRLLEVVDADKDPLEDDGDGGWNRGTFPSSDGPNPGVANSPMGRANHQPEAGVAVHDDGGVG